jgi:hypothetical protein
VGRSWARGHVPGGGSAPTRESAAGEGSRRALGWVGAQLGRWAEREARALDGPGQLGYRREESEGRGSAWAMEGDHGTGPSG